MKWRPGGSGSESESDTTSSLVSNYEEKDLLQQVEKYTHPLNISLSTRESAVTVTLYSQRSIYT